MSELGSSFDGAASLGADEGWSPSGAGDSGGPSEEGWAESGGEERSGAAGLEGSSHEVSIDDDLEPLEYGAHEQMSKSTDLRTSSQTSDEGELDNDLEPLEYGADQRASKPTNTRISRGTPADVWLDDDLEPLEHEMTSPDQVSGASESTGQIEASDNTQIGVIDGPTEDAALKGQPRSTDHDLPSTIGAEMPAPHVETPAVEVEMPAAEAEPATVEREASTPVADTTRDAEVRADARALADDEQPLHITESPDLMDTALPSGAEVKHGDTYTRIGEDEISVRVSENAPSLEGFHDVVAHGDGSDFVINGLETHPAQIAEAIRTNPNYAGQPIRLLSCSSARGPAQELANELGVEVTAPTSPVGTPRTPPFEVILEPGGEWKTFTPVSEEP